MACPVQHSQENEFSLPQNVCFYGIHRFFNAKPTSAMLALQRTCLNRVEIPIHTKL